MALLAHLYICGKARLRTRFCRGLFFKLVVKRLLSHPDLLTKGEGMRGNEQCDPIVTRLHLEPAGD
jgi:hypothetical protein